MDSTLLGYDDEMMNLTGGREYPLVSKMRSVEQRLTIARV